MSASIALCIALFYGFYASQPFILLMGPSNFGAIIGLIIGIIMKNPSEGVLVGAWIQFMYMGMVNYGGTKPSDQFAASVTAIPLAISTQAPLGISLLVATLFGAVSFPLDRLSKKINTNYWNVKIDNYVENLNFRKLSLATSIFPLITRMLISTPIIFLILYFGNNALSWFLKSGPEVLVTGMNRAGIALPALGIALFLTSIGRRNQFSYFAVGYLLILIVSLENSIVIMLSAVAAVIAVFTAKCKVWIS